MSGYELGDRVIITGTACKERGAERTSHVEGPLPGPQPPDLLPGIVVGWRTVMDYDVAYEYDDWTYQRVMLGPVPLPDTSRRVWLVAFDLRKNPVRCFDHQIRRAD